MILLIKSINLNIWQQILASNVSSHSSKFKSTFLCKECSLRIAFIHILTLDCAEVQFNMSAVSELQYYGLSRVYLCFPPPRYGAWCCGVSLQARLGYLTLRCWLRGFWREGRSDPIPSAPASCLPSSRSTSPTSSLRPSIAWASASLRLSATGSVHPDLWCAAH